MTTTWNKIKHQIRSELSKNSFSLWIDPLTLLDEKDKTLILGCANKFSRKWIMENYLDLIRDKLHESGSGHTDLVLKIQAPKKHASGMDPAFLPEQLVLPNVPTTRRPAKLCLNSDFIFDRFIVGRSNEFAYSASKALANGDTWNYQTLLMLANTGLGKSHLSQAVGHAICEENPQSRVYYITAEDFANEMISSLKTNRIEEFKNRYRRSCDVLILEEIHFLSGKEKIQLELGYTLDALINDHKKILFTSSLSPKDIPKMSKELSSRLTSGLVTTINKPDYDTRLKILERKASELGLVISEEIRDFLAGCLDRDIRNMESALKCLKAKSELMNVKIDLDLAKEVVRNLVSGDCRITTEDIKKLVSRYYKIDPHMLRARSRKKVYAYPRNIYAYLCRQHTDESLESIARTIDRSHSTVVYASEIVERRMKTDDKLMHQVRFLNKKLEGSEI